MAAITVGKMRRESITAALLITWKEDWELKENGADFGWFRLTGLYFTVRSRFFQFRHFGWIMRRTGGQMFGSGKEAKEDKQGMLSAFEAISTAIGGTVGFGNIAGVATAVAAGLRINI